MRRILKSALPAALLWALAFGPALAEATPSDGAVAPPAPAAAASEPTDAQASAVIQDARRLLASDDVRGAIDALAPYVAGHPDSLGAGRLLGDLYYRLPDFAAAERTYKSILALHPGDKETHNRLGGIYAAQDRINESLEHFEKSLPVASGFTGLVEQHRRLGDLSAWEHQLAAAAVFHPDDPRVQTLYGNVLRALRKYDIALDPLQRALRVAPSCLTLNNLANLYLDIGDVKRGLPLLSDCLRSDPNDYAALVNTGEAQIELGAYDRARPYFEKAARLKPDRAEAFVDLGYLEDVAAHWKEAIAYYRRAIAVDPLARDAYIDLGYDYNDHRLFALAEAAFLKGLSIVPFDGRLHYMLGVTYGQQGKTELARDQYQRAATSDEPIVAKAAKAELAAAKVGPG